MITIIIILAVYILSAYAFYKYTQIAHFHENGRFKNRFKPEFIELLITFMPIVNTTLSIVCWIGSPYRKSESNRISNFFKPKNK
jgi:hypothetical protein